MNPSTDPTPGPAKEASPPIGLIAAGGRLPVAAAEGIHAAGRAVACVALRGQYDPDLPSHCDRFRATGLIQLGKWIRTLRRWGAEEVVMVGKVRKAQMYDPMLWFRYLPDVRAAKLWFGRLRTDKRADRMLGAIADELKTDGLTMIDSTRYIPQLLAGEGVMTRTRPTAEQTADIDFALPIVRRMGDLDIGQAVAVKDRDIIAVEAIEGTDAMIERAGGLCRRGRWTLVKLAKPEQDQRFDVPTVGPQTIEQLKACGGTCLALEANQDMRFDVPTVGPTTIETMRRCGATCLAVEAERTILLDKPALLDAADAAGIAVVGLPNQAPAD